MAVLTGMKTKKVKFTFNAPSAKKVAIAGTFNNWNAAADPMKRAIDGDWQISLSLKPGKYEYKYIVDGNWANDPSCSSCVPNNCGSMNCVIEVK